MRRAFIPLAVLLVGGSLDAQATSRTETVCRRAYYPSGAIRCDSETRPGVAPDPFANATEGFLLGWALAATRRRPEPPPAPTIDPAVSARERDRERKRFNLYGLRARDVLDSALYAVNIGWVPADSFWAAGQRLLLDLYDVNPDAPTSAMWDQINPLVRQWDRKAIGFTQRFRSAFNQVADSLGLAGAPRDSARARAHDAAFTYFKLDLDTSEALLRISVRRAITK